MILKQTLIWFVLILTIIINDNAQANETKTTLRPGDSIMLSLPGENSLNKTIQVRRDGAILVPEIGEISVEGLSLTEATDKVRTQLSQVIHDLDRFEIVLKERRLMVNVLGYVKKPGAVDLPDGATIQEAISAAQGLTPGAQLDKMQVRRGGEVLNFNYKQYLDSGDLSLLPDLRPLDTVFVPASPLIGNVQVEFDAQTLTASGDASGSDQAVTVFGEVINPGTFSFKTDTSVVDFIMRAGGVTRYAGVEKIRVISNGEPVMFDLKKYLDTGNIKGLVQISPGDTIFVPKEVDDVKSGLTVVYVMGEVFKPGAFEADNSVSFLDILANAGGPTRFAETRQIRVIRHNGEVVPFDLQKFTDGGTTELPQVTPGDAIFVPEKTDINEKSWLKVPPSRAVKVMGEVHNPGRYEWSSEMSLFDLVAHAGGPNHKGNIAKLQVLSKNNQGEMVSTVFDMAQFIEKGGPISLIPKLKAGDIIVVPELPQDPSDDKAQWVRQSSEESIYVMGEVVAPGRYMFNKSLHFLDIISAAEGPNDNADLQNIRITHRSGASARVTKLDLSRYFETGDEDLLPRVQTGDVIFFPAKTKHWLKEAKEDTIRVLGAINKQGRYRYDNTMTILDLLAQAGGLASGAEPSQIVVINASCCQSGVGNFDLLEFAKTGDPRLLPALRTGDTVYVLHKEDSTWTRMLNGIQDTISVLSIFRILGGG